MEQFGTGGLLVDAGLVICASTSYIIADLGLVELRVLTFSTVRGRENQDLYEIVNQVHTGILDAHPLEVGVRSKNYERF